MSRFWRALGRWTAILLLSVVLACPPVVVVAFLGFQYSMHQWEIRNGPPAHGEDDLGMGLFAIGTAVAWLVGSTAVIWPVTTLLSCALFRRRQKRAR